MTPSAGKALYQNHWPDEASYKAWCELAEAQWGTGNAAECQALELLSPVSVSESLVQAWGTPVGAGSV